MGEAPDSTPIRFPRQNVWVLNVNPGKVADEFSDAISEMRAADLTAGWGCFAGKIAHRSGVNITKGRNEIVTKFLERTDPAGDWALILDSDMEPPPDTIVRLLAAAQHTDAKLVGALCVMIGPSGPIPTLYQYDDESPDGVTRVQVDYPEDTLLQVAATGCGCLMVHRDVFEAMAAADPDNPFPWFAERVINGKWVSEDIGFCLRAGQLGFRTFVDCTVSVGHAKHGRVWHARDIRDGTGTPKRAIVAVIPVKDRLDLTTDLVNQLRRQGEATDIVICDNGSGKATRNWLATQKDLAVLDMPDAGIHEMWNAGAELAVARYGHTCRVAFLNNDLHIGPQFLSRLADALNADHRLWVVGANYDGRTAGDATVEHVTDICAGRYDGTGGLPGFAFMVKAEVFTSNYRFPVECKWWFGDADIVRYCLTRDRPPAIALHATVEHIGGGGQTAGDVAWTRFSEQLQADQRAFEARWEAVAARDRQRAAHALEAAFGDVSRREPAVAYLRELAEEVKATDVIDLGSGDGNATIAWLAGTEASNGTVWAVDTQPLPFSYPRATFTLGEDIDPFVLAQLPETADIVHIDTGGDEEQSAAEIETYASRVRSGGLLAARGDAATAALQAWAQQADLVVGGRDGITVVWL